MKPRKPGTYLKAVENYIILQWQLYNKCKKAIYAMNYTKILHEKCTLMDVVNNIEVMIELHYWCKSVY